MKCLFIVIWNIIKLEMELLRTDRKKLFRTDHQHITYLLNSKQLSTLTLYCGWCLLLILVFCKIL